MNYSSNASEGALRRDLPHWTEALCWPIAEPGRPITVAASTDLVGLDQVVTPAMGRMIARRGKVSSGSKWATRLTISRFAPLRGSGTTTSSPTRGVRLR